MEGNFHMSQKVDFNGEMELGFNTVSPWMSEEDLLSQQGWFYLRDVFNVLDPEQTGKYKLAFKQIQRLIEKGKDPYEIMGRKKFGGRVGILMERFAPWYEANLILRTHKLDDGISFSDFLKKEGYFRLSEVCKIYSDFIPYSYAILKRYADNSTDPINEIGIVKFDTTYLVALPRFTDWLRAEILR